MSKHVCCLFSLPDPPALQDSSSSQRHAVRRVPLKNRLGRCRCSSVLRWTLRLSGQAQPVWVHTARSPITVCPSSFLKPGIASEVAHLRGTYPKGSYSTQAVNGSIRQIIMPLYKLRAPRTSMWLMPGFIGVSRLTTSIFPFPNSANFTLPPRRFTRAWN